MTCPRCDKDYPLNFFTTRRIGFCSATMCEFCADKHDEIRADIIADKIADAKLDREEQEEE